jgi:hypothetical protein
MISWSSSLRLFDDFFRMASLITARRSSEARSRICVMMVSFRPTTLFGNGKRCRAVFQLLHRKSLKIAALQSCHDIGVLAEPSPQCDHSDMRVSLAPPSLGRCSLTINFASPPLGVSPTTMSTSTDTASSSDVRSNASSNSTLDDSADDGHNDAKVTIHVKGIKGSVPAIPKTDKESVSVDREGHGFTRGFSRVLSDQRIALDPTITGKK